jgi:predicted RNase H-like nuclease (RuvC/YqgF family)
MERIIAIIENELRRQEDEIKLLNWRIEDLQRELKDKTRALEEMSRRRPFSEVMNDGKI